MGGTARIQSGVLDLSRSSHRTRENEESQQDALREQSASPSKSVLRFAEMRVDASLLMAAPAH
jgi:hypothetical protein